MFRKLSFKRKILVLVVTAVLGFVVLSVISTMRNERIVIEGRRAELVTAVQSAYNIAAAYQARAASGAMPEAEARRAAIEAIRVARYGGADGKSEYFYIWTTDGSTVMHPMRPEWDGKPMLGKLLDANGGDTLKRLLDAVAADSGGRAFAQAYFPRPGQTRAVPKLQFGMKVGGWNWVVGSGVYMDDLDALVHQGRIVDGAIALALLAVVAGVGYVIARGVLRQIGGEPSEAMAVMEEVARGNLGAHIRHTAPGSLMHGLETMIAALRRTIEQVRTSTESIRTASNEIAIGNTDLSQRTEETASSLQQTASSLEHLTSTVRQTADSARTASQLATAASDTAARGGEGVEQVVTTMNGIDESSRRIADIIGTIDGIAFQTNILALNAAVEAARAGEQGRGFAVVASEVRSLAQRSAGAAKEIKALIQTSVERVETGSKLVGDAGATMREIVVSVQRVTDIIGEITAASTGQSTEIGQINTAVGQLDQMTQQNAALVEESAAAAESLKQQALKLGEVVGVFRLGTSVLRSAAAGTTDDLDTAGAVSARARDTSRPTAAPVARAAVTPPARKITPAAAAVTPASAGASNSPRTAARTAPRKVEVEAETEGWETF